MSTNDREIPTRRLGRTNEFVSLVGMGGFHIGFPSTPDGEAIDLIHAGIDRGITFLDNGGTTTPATASCAWVARSRSAVTATVCS